MASVIHANSTPYISFYRYVGTRGFASSTSTTAPSTTTTTTTSAPETGSADLPVDTRDMSITPESYALRFGGDYDGSWKLFVKGGSGVHTSLVISYRKNGVWNSINFLGPFVAPSSPDA